MSGLHNLKPDRVVKAFERAGWTNEGQRGSHVKLTKEGNPNILSIPVHKGKPAKRGLLVDQISDDKQTLRGCFFANNIFVKNREVTPSTIAHWSLTGTK